MPLPCHPSINTLGRILVSLSLTHPNGGMVTDGTLRSSVRSSSLCFQVTLVFSCGTLAGALRMAIEVSPFLAVSSGAPASLTGPQSTF